MKLHPSVNEHDHSIGPGNATVTVVNYGDYQRPDCHGRHRAVEKMFNELVNTMRWGLPSSTLESKINALNIDKRRFKSP